MPDMNEFLRTVYQRYNGGFQPYAAGDKRYGATGRDAPNIGPTSGQQGYAERDRAARTRRNLMLKRMKAIQQGNYMDPSYLNNSVPGTFFRN